MEFVPNVCLCLHSRRCGTRESLRYDRCVAEESAQPLEQQLEEIRTQLAWVRDYL